MLSKDSASAASDFLTTFEQHWKRRLSQALAAYDGGRLAFRFVGAYGLEHLSGDRTEAVRQIRGLLSQGYELVRHEQGFCYLTQGLPGGGPLDELEKKLDMKSASQRSVFITYQWAQKDIAQALHRAFEAKGYLVIRDESNLSHGVYLPGFMKIIGHRNLDYILPVISESYLKSKNCMYEVNQIVKRYQWEKSLLPYVVSAPDADPKIYGEGLGTYLDYWKQECEKETDVEKREVVENIQRNIRPFVNAIVTRINIPEAELIATQYRALFKMIEELEKDSDYGKFREIQEALQVASASEKKLRHDKAKSAFDTAIIKLDEIEHVPGVDEITARVYGLYGEYLRRQQSPEAEQYLQIAGNFGYQPALDEERRTEEAKQQAGLEAKRTSEAFGECEKTERRLQGSSVPEVEERNDLTNRGRMVNRRVLPYFVIPAFSFIIWHWRSVLNIWLLISSRVLPSSVLPEMDAQRTDVFPSTTATVASTTTPVSLANGTILNEVPTSPVLKTSTFTPTFSAATKMSTFRPNLNSDPVLGSIPKVEGDYALGLAFYQQSRYREALSFFLEVSKDQKNPNYPAACFKLWRLYELGRGIPMDKAKAQMYGKVVEEHVHWFIKQAQVGTAEAQVNLGVLYQYGQGVTQDDAQAKAWWEKAAAQGDAVAQTQLGVLYASGQGVAQDDAQSKAWWEKAAAQGDARAQRNLGVLYQYGHGVTQDYAQAKAWLDKAAAQGDAVAQTQLGVLYQYGQGVTQDDAQAKAWWEKAAAQGDAVAQTQLGVLYQYGHGVTQDYAQAKAWLDKAAAQGDAVAQTQLGVLYQYGQGVTQDDAQAKAWYEKAAAQGDAKAQRNLGALYYKGHGVTQDYAQAKAWLDKAAAQGDAVAQTQLGFLYASGRGATQDDAQAKAWYEKAAAQGDAMAQTGLGALYQYGQGVTQDYAQAKAWYEKAAAQGDAMAQTGLGALYYKGHGVTQDYAQAKAWLDKAAAQGDAEAQTGLGALYQYGQGVTQDYAKAKAWWEKAAAQGDAMAQTGLGALYQYGQGVTQDYAKAKAWWEKAAAQGDAVAQTGLGALYQYGQGVTQDDAQAKAWYEKAAAQGNAVAQENLAKLSQEESPKWKFKLF